LNMPRMDGRTALMHMKADRAFRRIPVIVLTTSTAEEDIQQTYDLGVSAYIPKPGSYSELLELVESLNSYWMRFVALPAA
jgi:CheY-like chemotaxis protein